MAKWLRRWWTRIYELEPQVKIKNTFTLLQHEGMFTDENELLVNGVSRLQFEAGVEQSNGIVKFNLYDKPYELRFNYSIWAGNPRSIIILQNQRILAQFGDDSALEVRHIVSSVDSQV